MVIISQVVSTVPCPVKVQSRGDVQNAQMGRVFLLLCLPGKSITTLQHVVSAFGNLAGLISWSASLCQNIPLVSWEADISY